MEGEFEDQGQIDQDLEEWLYSRGSQPNNSFFSEEYRQEYTYIEGLDTEGAKISNQASEGEIYTW